MAGARREFAGRRAAEEPWRLSGTTGAMCVRSKVGRRIGVAVCVELSGFSFAPSLSNAACVIFIDPGPCNGTKRMPSPPNPALTDLLPGLNPVLNPVLKPVLVPAIVPVIVPVFLVVLLGLGERL